MKTKRIMAAALGILALAAAGYAAGTMLFVQVEKAVVRDQPNYFSGKVVATLAYGESAEQLDENGPWFKVRLADGKEGWISKSAVTETKVALKSVPSSAADAGGTNAKADAEEVALAGRGFSPQVEQQYRAGKRELDNAYSWIDYMEKDKTFNVTEKDMADFLAAGGVVPANGGK